jgi:hypothetical protein
MRGVADLLAAGVSGTYVAPSDVFAAYLQAGDKDLAARGSFRDSAADDADAVVGDVPTDDGGVQVDDTGVVEDPSPADERRVPAHGRGVQGEGAGAGVVLYPATNEYIIRARSPITV